MHTSVIPRYAVRNRLQSKWFKQHPCVVDVVVSDLVTNAGPKQRNPWIDYLIQGAEYMAGVPFAQ